MDGENKAIIEKGKTTIVNSINIYRYTILQDIIQVYTL